MTSFRIFEIILYSCLNLLPYLGLALYPFADKLRFSKVKVGLFIFLLFLVGIVFSVSSYIFDREKGFGFTTKKKDKGYSRWCSEKEMKKTVKEVDPSEDKAEAGGIVVINNGKKLWVDDGGSS